MKCKTFMDNIDAFVGRALPEAEYGSMEQHIAECSGCRLRAESLGFLLSQAASLPRSVMPERDLWPEIASRLAITPFPEPHPARKPAALERQPGRNIRLTLAGWAWRVAAAAAFGIVLILAATHLRTRLQMSAPSGPVSSEAGQPKAPGNQETRPLETGPRLPGISHRMQPYLDLNAGAYKSGPGPGYHSFPLETGTSIFTSNFGIYAVRTDFERSFYYPELSNSLTQRFEQDGSRSPWVPILPPGSKVGAIYPSAGSHLFVSYEIRRPQYKTTIAEGNFGTDSQLKELWQSSELIIMKFVVSAQGMIYGLGFRHDYTKSVEKLAKGQSIAAESLHIIDPNNGQERHLFPITLKPTFQSPNWVGQTFANMVGLLSDAVVSVKSNGNFFISINPSKLMSQGLQRLIYSEAIEYSPEGEVERTWDVGIVEANTFISKIFVDLDDSLLVEIVKYEDTAVRPEPAGNAVIDRYLIRVDRSGKLLRYGGILPPGEVVLGWIGQTRELVTQVVAQKEIKEVRIRKLP